MALSKKGINVRESAGHLMFRALLQDGSGAKVTSGTTSLRLYEIQSDGTFKSYDFSDNTFKATALTTETQALTHRTGNNGGTNTGIWTYALTTLTGFTAGGIYLASVNNTSASPTDQVREFQFGGAESDFLAPTSAGRYSADATAINAVATTSVTTVNANLGQTQPVNFTGTGASALVKGDAIDVAGVAQTGGDLYPAVANIAVTSAALNTTASAATITTGTPTNTYTSTATADGVYHSVADSAGTTDFYYQFDVSGTTGAVGVGVNWLGYVSGVVNTLKVYAYNWGSTTWDQIGTVVGIAGTTNGSEDWEITSAHTGTGGNAGLVRIRFNATGLTSSSTKTDRILLGYAVVALAASAAPANFSSLSIDASGRTTLAPAGLDAIAVTDPGAPASHTSIAKMLVAVWRWLYKKTTLTSTQLKAYQDNGSDVNATATVSDDGTTQTKGALS